MLDILIRGGEVADGSGGPLRQVDIGIESGNITQIDSIGEGARTIIDATGLVVCPGSSMLTLIPTSPSWSNRGRKAPSGKV